MGSRWQKVQFRFMLRQLAFYLPDNTALLRVENPYQFGDDASQGSPVVAATNKLRQPQVGFEISPWSTGLRATVPIMAVDGRTNERVHLGTIEVGTSFDPMFVPICPSADCGLAVLFTPDAVAGMTPESRDAAFTADRHIGDWYVEASSNPALTQQFIAQHTPSIGKMQTTMLKAAGDRLFGVTYFPLQGFWAGGGTDHPPVGVVAVWQEATDLVHEFNKSQHDIFVVAALGFFVVVIVLVVAVRFVTSRLEQEIANRTAEVHDLLTKVTILADRDGLTGLYNRRNFDRRMTEEVSRAGRTGERLSLVLIDLDHFKE